MVDPCTLNEVVSVGVAAKTTEPPPVVDTETRLLVKSVNTGLLAVRLETNTDPDNVGPDITGDVASTLFPVPVFAIDIMFLVESRARAFEATSEGRFIPPANRLPDIPVSPVITTAPEVVEVLTVAAVLIFIVVVDENSGLSNSDAVVQSYVIENELVKSFPSLKRDKSQFGA